MERIKKLFEMPDNRTEEEKALDEASHKALYYCIDRIDTMTMDENMEFWRLVEKYHILKEKYELSKKIKKELLEECKASNAEKKIRAHLKKNN